MDKRLDPLFKDENEYEEFKYRHSLANVGKAELKDYEGECFLGIDAGSTTTKAVVINSKGELVYTYYASNKGNPVMSAVNILKTENTALKILGDWDNSVK